MVVVLAAVAFYFFALRGPRCKGVAACSSVTVQYTVVGYPPPVPATLPEITRTCNGTAPDIRDPDPAARDGGGMRLDIGTEQSIFQVLGLPYRQRSGH